MILLKKKYLWMIKSLINRLVRLFPVEAIPNVKPKTVEGSYFNERMLRVIETANVNRNGQDLENFLEFAEMLRRVGLYLIENDSFYRRYATLFLNLSHED